MLLASKIIKVGREVIYFPGRAADAGGGGGGGATTDLGPVGAVNSSINWQYFPVRPLLHTQIKSGKPFGCFGVGMVLVGMQVPPDKHGLFEQESGKKQLFPFEGEQHEPVKMSHKKHEPGESLVGPVQTQS